MDPNNGCDPSAVFLRTEIGPPSNSFGCCANVNGGPSTDASPIDRIGSLPGNRVSADCSYYVNNSVIVTVTVWDTAGGNRRQRLLRHHRLLGLQITGCPGAKNLSGVWRRAVFQGLTLSTPGFAGAAMGVQLIK